MPEQPNGNGRESVDQILANAQSLLDQLQQELGRLKEINEDTKGDHVRRIQPPEHSD